MQVSGAEASYTLSRSCTDIFAQGAPKQVSDVLKEKGLDLQVVKVDISEEGLSAYKEMYKNSGQDRNFKNLNLRIFPGEMAWGNEGWPDIKEFLNCGYTDQMMTGKVPQAYFDRYVSIKDKASMLMSAYAVTYDEIVRGYENGTREKYVVDMETDELYRKVTMEEDLDYLNKEFERRASSLEKRHKADCEIRRMSAECAKGGFLHGMSLREVLRSTIYYERLKDEENITGIKQKMLDAAAVFAGQYEKYGLSRLNLQVL